MVKKRILIAMLAALFLAGCGKTETMETVADEMDVPVLAQPRKISVELPGQAEAALETDAGQLYVTDDYEIALETLDGGDLNGTLQALSGRTAEELTVLETRTEDGMKRYEFVWACAGEEGDRLGRAVILDDGNYHYCLSVLRPADRKEPLRWYGARCFSPFLWSNSEQIVCG